MPPILDESDHALPTYSGYNSASDPLQALFAHINQDDEFESDVDLYFKTLVVKHRRSSDDDLNWVLNW
jgi:glucuronate isomerase